MGAAKAVTSDPRQPTPTARWLSTHQVLHGGDELPGEVGQPTEGRAHLHLAVGVTVDRQLLHGTDVVLQVRDVVWRRTRTLSHTSACGVSASERVSACVCVCWHLVPMCTWLWQLSSSSATPGGRCPAPEHTHTHTQSEQDVQCVITQTEGTCLTAAT